jgi:hypothetical protein
MRGKEFLIRKCPTQEDALAQLFEALLAHLRDKPPVWQWRGRPEIKQHESGWSAYARIEYP